MQKVTDNPFLQYNNAVEGQSLDESIKESALTGLNYIVDGLDYLGNISRTAINAYVQDRDIVQHVSEAATYKRRTYSDELKRNLATFAGQEGALSFS